MLELQAVPAIADAVRGLVHVDTVDQWCGPVTSGCPFGQQIQIILTVTGVLLVNAALGRNVYRKYREAKSGEQIIPVFSFVF